MPFENELGDALRSAGAGFTPDPNALVEAGERRGRRLLARRRAAVAGGSVLALALLGTGGAWSAGLIAAGPADVAAAPRLPGRDPARPGGAAPQERAGTGAVSAAQMIAVLASLTPGGRLSGTEGRGTEDQAPMAMGVVEDGRGPGRLGVLLTRIDPVGAMAREMTTCPDRKDVPYDSCTEEVRPDGSRLLLIQDHVYNDSRKGPKEWRATLATPQGFLVDASEFNAPASKGAAVSRPEPPLTMERMKALVLSDKWRPALEDLPPAPSQTPPGTGDVDAENALEHLLRTYGIPVADRGGDGEYGYAVLDDGEGRSLVELRIRRNADGGDFPADAADAADRPLGVRVKTSQGPARGAAPGTVAWTVDTLRPGGVRLTVTAYNAPKQAGPPSRTAPALTVERLREIALSEKWKDVLGG